MTETTPAPEQTEDGEEYGPVPPPAVTYPEFPENPHNHRYTVSMNGQGPMVVIRANTAREFNAALEELREEGCGAALGSFWSDFRAAAMVANGLGGATQMPQGAPQAPQGPPMPPQGATPPPFGPNVSVPAAPGYQGPPAPAYAQAPAAPAAPQWGGQAPQGGGQSRNGPKPRPNWAQVYKIEVPFQSKDQFKQYREQYKDAFKGKVSWAGGGSYWVDGSIVQSFVNYNPVPA